MRESAVISGFEKPAPSAIGVPSAGRRDDVPEERGSRRDDGTYSSMSVGRSRGALPDPFIVGDLPEVWRIEVNRLRQFGATSNAATLEAAAEQLEAALRAEADTTLTVSQAAAESGYSPDHIERMLRQGRLRNVGRKHAPRVRRADLPHKPGGPPGALTPVGTEPISKAQIARALIDPPHQDDR